jgi:energy-coupling factor transport system ATP-binding protein
MDTREREVYELANYVGLVFQDPFSMLFARSVEEELSYGPKNLGVGSDEVRERVMEASAKCGLERLLKYSPFATSPGEKKRISVASILTMRPTRLILDEPTAGQDYASYTQFMDFIMGLFGSVKTLIIITHDTDLAVEYTDRTIILSNGRIIADGPTRSVLANEDYLRAGKIRETSLIEMGKRITGGKMVLSLREILESCS